MHQATCVTGIRRARYIGLGKTRLEHLAAATAINVIRLDAWYSGNPWTGPGPPTFSVSIWYPKPLRLRRIKQTGSAGGA